MMRLILLLILSLILCARTGATTIDPLLWEEMFETADFVGIVECVTAGGIVAKYKVLECWKGTEEPGKEISIRTEVNYWEPQFPLALCGQKAFVAVYKGDAPCRVMSSSGGPACPPLWFRRIHWDYTTPLFQGIIFDPENNTGSFGENSPASARTLQDFKKWALEHMAKPPEKREMELFLSLCKKYVLLNKASGNQDADKLAKLKEEIKRCDSLADALAAFLKFSKDADPSDSNQWRTFAILSKTTGPCSDSALEKMPPELFPSERFRADLLKRREESRARANTPLEKARPEGGDSRPSEEEIAKMAGIFEAGKHGKNSEWPRAFDFLTSHAPEKVTDYLARWQNPKKTWADTDMGYFLGSYFAWKCGGDREKHLRKLLAANDEFIRVAGAVYLAFENEREGLVELGRLTKLNGDPGAWAALALARRGDKTVAPRLFQAFSVCRMGGGMSEVPHRNLLKRILELLSNSCKKSGGKMPEINLHPRFAEEQPRPLPEEQPRPLPEDDPLGARKTLMDWWGTNKDRITLDDPWMPELIRQKVD